LSDSRTRSDAHIYIKMTLDTTRSSEALYTQAQHVSETTFSEELLTVAEISQLLKVPVSWVYERTRRRGLDQLPHFKLGKYLRFSKKEVLDWLQKTKGI
jgi:excisionase family DNA binding protein